MLTWENELYTEEVIPIELQSISNNRVDFFIMNDKCYILDGANYFVYDGTILSEVTPYIPTIFISKNPTGGGESFEDFNLLGAGFKDSFSGDGTTTVYQLSLTNLDATPITAVVNGANMVETTDFAVDRTLGTVTFNTAPSTGTNNVIITAYKTQTGFADRIKKCRFHEIFGGSNDTRVFLSGNPDMPDYVWASDLYRPDYFPENRFYKFQDKVMGFSKQYDYLVVHREHGKHVINFELTDGVSSFPSKPINDQVGTLSTHSIQIIDNSPVSLSNDGVYILTASNVRDERNVQHISENIDNKLLREPNLNQAVSVDYDKKYWLAVNGNVYLFDYRLSEWFLYNNINANCFIEIDGDLYFGNSAEGLIYRFNRETETLPYNDDTQPIEAYWKSKQFTFGADERKKLVEKMFMSLKPYARTSADISYISNKKESDIVKSSRMDMFDFRDVDFTRFTFYSTVFPQEIMAKIKAKKVTHFQLIIKNDKLNESLGVLSLGVKYKYQALIK